MKVTRTQSKRPNGSVGPVRFSFEIKVEGESGQNTRARAIAQADAEAWCREMRASGLVFQFEQIDDGWTKPGQMIYIAYFGTDLWLEKGPGE
ncbi:hypothetical protein SEA_STARPLATINUM_251 [Streptomyces phage StarPlatinum]|uniref:Uncharacterized protein n=1 Tax=Streptomyces phage StarPlatinum TaxID=2283265 RepID=A0A345M8Y4_9CAUD|nr:hypothetical protein HWB77_gp081 [Streptomyces phage StarPlatinum]AXH66955.1 hypothetical protein SEA_STARPLATINUM_251 [Streptomyces phage StarPlatinum]